MNNRLSHLLSLLVWMLLLIPFHRSFAQEDSLSLTFTQILRSGLKENEKADSLNSFASKNLNRYPGITDSALHEAIRLARQSGYPHGEGVALYLLSRREEAQGNLKRARQFILGSITLLKAEKPAPLLARAYLHAGWVCRRMLEKGQAMEYSMQGLKLAEKLADTVNIGNGYNNIAILFVGIADYDKALKYHKQALHWRELSGDKIAAALSHGNMGIVYMNLKQYDKALQAHFNGLKIVSAAKIPAEIAFSYNDIGSTYLYKGNTDSAIHYLRKSIAMREEMNETSEIAYTYNYLGEAYEKAGNRKEGEKWIKKALQTAIGIHNSKQHQEALESLSDFYARNNRYDSAYAYLRKHKLYSDSINQTARAGLIDELATQYETEKKEQQIEILNQKTAIQKLQLRQRSLLLLGTVIILSAITLFIYFIQNRRKLRAETRLQQKLVQQQQQAANEVLQAEERERRRIATDLHDGVGQMLSAVLLNLNQAHEHTEAHTPAWEMTEKALALLGESYDEMRSISHQMMPNALLKAGLASSIKEFLEKIDGNKIKVRLDVSGFDERLGEQTETVLYRIIQESVNNVIKHANATKLSIQLSQDAAGIYVTVEDNGKGFDTTHMANFSGIGLKNIFSRIALLGGTVDVDSTIGKGSLLAFHIPKGASLL